MRKAGIIKMEDYGIYVLKKQLKTERIAGLKNEKSRNNMNICAAK